MNDRILAYLLGYGFALAGVGIFLFPETFFALLASYYGEYNLHFVKDAGLAFLASGVLLLLSNRHQYQEFAYTLGGALFVLLHGAFHAQMLLMGMVSTLSDLAFEFALNLLPALLVLWLVWLRHQKSR